MNRSSAALVALLLLISGQLFAKAPTSKITLEDADLKAIAEVTDSKLLKDFPIWGELNIDPGKGEVTERPTGLRRYQVSFYAKVPPYAKPPTERRMYVVFYEYDPATAQGYVYLPARGEQWYPLNVSTMIRGVEGKWFRASKAWDKIAGPLLTSAKVAAPH